MAKVGANTLKPGMVLEYQGGLWSVVKTEHVKPGKGGAFAQVEMKNLVTGTKLNERFRSEETLDRAILEQRDHSFLYEDGEMLVFMDQENYEQIHLSKEWVGEDQIQYLHDGMVVVIESHDEKPISMSLPDTVVLEVMETEPTIKGQTASSSYKPAKASNGMRIMIPPFMGVGERIVVSTVTGEYMKRAD